MNYYLTINGTRLFPITSLADEQGRFTGRFVTDAWIERVTAMPGGSTSCVVLRDDGMMFDCDRCEFHSTGANGLEEFSGAIVCRRMAENPGKIQRAMHATAMGRA